MESTPENITELDPNQIFVFGSNLVGNHAGGAAKIAHEKFDAEWGVGEGRTGHCYAFPTLNQDMSKRTLEQLKRSAESFLYTAELYPDKTFLLTKVGCGIAGFDEKDMKDLFLRSPKNVIKPLGW